MIFDKTLHYYEAPIMHDLYLIITTICALVAFSMLLDVKIKYRKVKCSDRSITTFTVTRVDI